MLENKVWIFKKVEGVETDQISLVEEDAGNWTSGQVGVGQLVGSKYGISAPTLARYLGRTPTRQDVAEVTWSVFDYIMSNDYWTPINGDALFSGLDYTVFDFGYNAGPKTSTKLLQRQLGVYDDGNVGPKTLQAIAEYSKPVVKTDWVAANVKSWPANNKAALIINLTMAQVSYYISLHSYAQKGWLNRCSARVVASLGMIR